MLGRLNETYWCHCDSAIEKAQPTTLANSGNETGAYCSFADGELPKRCERSQILGGICDVALRRNVQPWSFVFLCHARICLCLSVGHRLVGPSGRGFPAHNGLALCLPKTMSFRMRRDPLGLGLSGLEVSEQLKNQAPMVDRGLK